MDDGEYVRYRPSNFRKNKATMRNMDGTFSTYNPTKPHEVFYAQMGGHASITSICPQTPAPSQSAHTSSEYTSPHAEPKKPCGDVAETSEPRKTTC